MASPKTLALRTRMDALAPTPIRLDVDPAPRTALPGEFRDTLRLMSLNANARRRRERAAANGPRDTPTSGPGRRRAKARQRILDAETCITRRDGNRCKARALEGAVHCRLHTAPPPHLLADILAYCDAHPHPGPLPAAQPLTLHRHDDGTITVEGATPDVLDVSVPLLDSNLLRGLTFTRGVLTVHTSPEPLRYRPLGRCESDFAVRFGRIRDEGAA